MAEFGDSVEATEFMDNVADMLNDPRLDDWANATDMNYSGDTVKHLKAAQESFALFLEAMCEAE